MMPDVVVPPEVEAEWGEQLDAYARALEAELDAYFKAKRKFATVADIVKAGPP